MSTSVVFSSMQPSFEDTFVTSIPADDVIGQQLSSQLDATQNFIQDMMHVFLHHLLFESLHSLSIILLLAERLRSSRVYEALVERGLREAHIHLGHSKKRGSKLSSDDQKLILLLVISFAFLATRLCYARRPWSHFLAIAVILSVSSLVYRSPTIVR